MHLVTIHKTIGIKRPLSDKILRKDCASSISSCIDIIPRSYGFFFLHNFADRRDRESVGKADVDKASERAKEIK